MNVKRETRTLIKRHKKCCVAVLHVYVVLKTSNLDVTEFIETKLVNS